MGQMVRPAESVLLTWRRGVAGSSHIQRQLKMRVRCRRRAADWGIIYKEEMIEAEGMDESSAEMNKSQE